MSGGRSSVTLRALFGAPLSDDGVRGTVVASANAIGERIGVPIVRIEATDDSVTATLDADRLIAIGFAAELRRVTNAWYRSKFGADLWGPDPEADS